MECTINAFYKYKWTVLYLLIAVFGNALGTALMANTNMGMTAWGSSAKNVSVFFNVSLGTGFIILSIVFYSTAMIIRKRIILRELILSTIFLFSFSILADFFTALIPDMSEAMLWIRVSFNIIGLLVLMFAIAVHIKVNIAVHPMDVYLREMQIKLNSISLGTYISYFSAFLITIVFGLAKDGIQAIGLGTINTLIFGGVLLEFYNKYILEKWKF